MVPEKIFSSTFAAPSLQLLDAGMPAGDVTHEGAVVSGEVHQPLCRVFLPVEHGVLHVPPAEGEGEARAVPAHDGIGDVLHGAVRAAIQERLAFATFAGGKEI